MIFDEVAALTTFVVMLQIVPHTVECGRLLMVFRLLPPLVCNQPVLFNIGLCVNSQRPVQCNFVVK